MEEESVYELASGDTVKCNYGFVLVKFTGFETVTQVVFGPENCEPIIGIGGTGERLDWLQSGDALSRANDDETFEKFSS